MGVWAGWTGELFLQQTEGRGGKLTLALHLLQSEITSSSQCAPNTKQCIMGHCLPSCHKLNQQYNPECIITPLKIIEYRVTNGTEFCNNSL